ncbi:hypothetical protein RND81_10G139000 [Saponaria officinalis]|uniref:DUF674 domain-containing protein n=1 Tax=Saponaria officinalis TaxID=3572 RepID=A0AAW1I325_SAPOF
MEGTGVNEAKLRLKIMVDLKAKKVVFAEAGKDFVDFLFHMLSLPLATVVKLLSKRNMMGSLPALCKSVKSLSIDYFEEDVDEDKVLLPKIPVTLPLLSLNYTPDAVTYYKCRDHTYVSCHSGAICPHTHTVGHDGLLTIIDYGLKPMQKVELTYVAPESENELPGFVKKAVPYMVMDNLEVKPLSVTLIKSLVSDFDNLVEEEVQFGLKECDIPRKQNENPSSTLAKSDVILMCVC